MRVIGRMSKTVGLTHSYYYCFNTTKCHASSTWVSDNWRTRYTLVGCKPGDWFPENWAMLGRAGQLQVLYLKSQTSLHTSSEKESIYKWAQLLSSFTWQVLRYFKLWSYLSLLQKAWASRGLKIQTKHWFCFFSKYFIVTTLVVFPIVFFRRRNRQRQGECSESPQSAHLVVCSTHLRRIWNCGSFIHSTNIYPESGNRVSVRF